MRIVYFIQINQFVPKIQINNKLALLKTMARHRTNIIG